MIVKDLIKQLLDCDLNSEVIIQTDRLIQGRKISIESNYIKDIIPATEKYPKTYTIINGEFRDEQRKDG